MSQSIDEKDYLEQVKELKKKVQILQQQNVEKVKGLMSYGRNVNEDFLVQLKMDVFIEMFLDDLSKLRYVLALETRLQQELNSALSQVRTDSLKVNPGNLIIPK